MATQVLTTPAPADQPTATAGELLAKARVLLADAEGGEAADFLADLERLAERDALERAMTAKEDPITVYWRYLRAFNSLGTILSEDVHDATDDAYHATLGDAQEFQPVDATDFVRKFYGLCEDREAPNERGMRLLVDQAARLLTEAGRAAA